MNTKQLLDAMHNPVQVFDGEYVRPNICERTFVVYIDNANDTKTCVNYIGNRCYRKFFGGQMEDVLENLVAISFIKTPRELIQVIQELRKLGVTSTLQLCVEYIEGYVIPFKEV